MEKRKKERKNNKNLKEANKRFFRLIAKCYDVLFGNRIINMQRRAIENLNIKNGSRILDAGAGTGNLLMLLERYEKEKQMNLELYGIDISKEMLEIARKKLKSSKLRIQEVEKLNFKNNYFDYVFSTDAFHHYFNHSLAMENFYRVLKKNGYLIVVDLNFGQILNKIFHKIEPGNSKVYTLNELRVLFKSHGFKHIKQEKVGLFTFMTSGRK